MIGTVTGRGAAAMVRLQAAIVAETAAQAAKAWAILDLALTHEWREGDEFEMVGSRPVRIGGEGTALVDEALPLEVAALTATSVASVTLLIRDVVNLHGRLPSVWRAVLGGRVPLWRACQLSRVADTFGLGYGECLRVDGPVPWFTAGQDGCVRG